MVNEIISGVSMKLNETFGDGYRIYQNDVKQGLMEPCFFIAVLEPLHRPYLGRRRQITTPLDIHFFPEKNGDNKTMLEVADELFSALEYITTTDGEDMLRGREMRYSIQDSVLHFFVSYSVILNEHTAEDAMEELDVQAGTTGEK